MVSYSIGTTAIGYQPHVAMAPPSLQRQRSGIALTKLKSVTNLFAEASLNDLPGAAAFNNGVAVYNYVNSRLPMDLKPMRLYFNTYPLISLAAQYSERVYSKPTGQEKETRVNAGGRAGTVMKSTKPASPEGFLDDPGNLCHSGFLGAAKSWIKPIAARLRNLLQENPERTHCSLLITGHSAGGAIAALLYSHMLSTSPEARSELNILAGIF
ncbi:hypothetical protein DID88_003605 [Monilinia fructigena]|uniref:Fungal lipase-type domain-containing protein n=1 Tax=Monilinia fructigena TaxID=38457 RepID=A0A395ITV0_9HELO|nr:hypothetical protein DID88_003605 [Monilinia fructigena]